MSVRAETQIDLARVDDGSPGTPGANGATFTPSVDSAGNISWTNDGGLPNPQTQNIMGPSSQYFWYESSGADAGAHITEVPQDEWTDSSDPNYHSGGNMLAQSTKIAIRDGMTELAAFGASGATIGVTDGTQSYLMLDYHSMQSVSREGTKYFYVSDLRDANGEATIEKEWTSNGVTTSYSFSPVDAEDTNYTVSVSDSSGGTITKNISGFQFSSPPTSGATITATYTTTSVWAKAYTLGRRDSGPVGPMSLAEGRNTVASGNFSHSEGLQTKAQGDNSHAEGNTTRAIGRDSHAEGDYAQAIGGSSHAEGSYSKAIGGNSHAGGYKTIAQGTSQTVIGELNIAQGGSGISPTDFVVIIGNGSSENARSDALEIDWTGNVFLGLDTTAASGTDHDLYAAITALGWGSAVIV